MNIYYITIYYILFTHCHPQLFNDLISQVTVLEINISVSTLSRLTGCVVCCGVMATYSIIIQLQIVYDIVAVAVIVYCGIQ